MSIRRDFFYCLSLISGPPKALESAETQPSEMSQG